MGHSGIDGGHIECYRTVDAVFYRRGETPRHPEYSFSRRI